MNDLWSTLLLQELARGGVGLTCLCPGSRSSSLAIAATAPGAPPWMVHTDERGAAFAALGFARAHRRPAVVITTSGTAVANLLPAAAEADREALPLIFLTADRPPELRDTGANQTLDQTPLLSGCVRWLVDVPPPSADVSPRWLLSTVGEALSRARGTPAGPVQLNTMFREPLSRGGITREELAQALEDDPALARWAAGTAPFTRSIPAAPSFAPLDGDVADLAREVEGRPGVITVGSLDEPGEDAAEAILRLSDRLGWPILPDIRSPFRLAPRRGRVLPYAELLRASGLPLPEEDPDRVHLHLGRPPVSKRWQSSLAASPASRSVMVASDPRRMDPAFAWTDRIAGPEGCFARALCEALGTGAPGGGAQDAWERVHQRVVQALETHLPDSGLLTEKSLARHLPRWLPAGHGLFLGNSMPIRDVDLVGHPAGHSLAVAANRGVSGIDGQIATAAGWGRGRGAPVTILLGDLGGLHDLNSLELVARAPVPMLVVVVNNDGGGIFSHLPVASLEVPFEPLFGTPHGRTFHHAAALFGLSYAAPDSLAGVRAEVERFVSGGGRALIEVRTDREGSRAEHNALLDRVTRPGP